MIIRLLVIHILVAAALVGVILLQKSEGGALGMGGGMSGFMTGRSTANLLTRATAILAAVFMMTSILLVVINNRERTPASIIGEGAPSAPSAPSLPPPPQAPPAEPAQPSAPLAR
jgi:preprotein translocase subunit SecG